MPETAAMAHSRIVLSTPFGARGVADEDLRDGRNGLVVSRTTESFLSELERVVLDADAREAHERQARALVAAKFSPETFDRQRREALAGGLMSSQGGEAN